MDEWRILEDLGGSWRILEDLLLHSTPILLLAYPLSTLKTDFFNFFDGLRLNARVGTEYAYLAPLGIMRPTGSLLHSVGDVRWNRDDMIGGGRAAFF